MNTSLTASRRLWYWSKHGCDFLCLWCIQLFWILVFGKSRMTTSCALTGKCLEVSQNLAYGRKITLQFYRCSKFANVYTSGLTFVIIWFCSRNECITAEWVCGLITCAISGKTPHFWLAVLINIPQCLISTGNCKAYCCGRRCAGRGSCLLQGWVCLGYRWSPRLAQVTLPKPLAFSKGTRRKRETNLVLQEAIEQPPE